MKLEILLEIFQEWGQNLVPVVIRPTMSIVMSATMDRLFPEDVNEGVADVQQILPTAEIS